MTSYWRLTATADSAASSSASRLPIRPPLEISSLPLHRNQQRLRGSYDKICLTSSSPPFYLSLTLSRRRRSSERRLSSFAGLVGPGGGEEVGTCQYSVGGEAQAVSAERISEGHLEGGRKEDRRMEVAVAVAATVVLGVGNRVLYKLALIPLKHYPFFLAQLATLGSLDAFASGFWLCIIIHMLTTPQLVFLNYVAVYFTILYIRYHAGIVTHEMLSMPKAPYLLVGLIEALAAATGMAAAAMLSGASIPILSQTFLVWQILLSIIFLGRRYKVNQLLGCLLVTIGVIITVASGSSPGHSLKDAGIFWTLLMIFSFFLQAADTVLKEIIFLNSCQQLKGSCIDLFIVKSYGSAFQAFFVCILLPFMSKLWGVPFRQLPNYLKDGADCFLNIGGLTSGCDGAPLLPLLFVIVNMGFNISLLHLIRISSAVVSSLASTFSAGFVAGAIILVVGLLIYAWTPCSNPTSASLTSPG